MMLKKQIADLGVSLFGLAAARVFSLLSSVLIARVAGAATFGEYSFFISVFVLLSEVPNAIDTTFIRFSNYKNEIELTESYQLISIIIKLLYVFFIIFISFFLGEALAVNVFNKPGIEGMLKGSMLAASFMCLHTLIISSYQQKHKFKHVSFIRPVSGMFIFIVFVYIEFNDLSFSGDRISNVYIYVTALLACISLIILIPKTIYRYRESIGLMYGFIKVASVLVLSSIVGLIASRLDVFVMTSSMTFEEIGQYGVAIRMSILVSLITAAMTTIYVPKASAASKNYKEFISYLYMMLTYSVVQTILALIIIYKLDFLLFFIFGSEYIDVKGVAVILIVQVLFEAYSRGFQALIQCGPKPHVIFYGAVIRLILSAMLLIYLIPLYGVIGGAISVAITSGVVALLIMWVAIKDCTPPKLTTV